VWPQWPRLRERYRVVATATERDMPHVYSGAGAAAEKVRPLLFPQFFLEPVPAPAPPPPAAPRARAPDDDP
jgi:hypothetical protein